MALRLTIQKLCFMGLGLCCSSVHSSQNYGLSLVTLESSEGYSGKIGAYTTSEISSRSELFIALTFPIFMHSDGETDSRSSIFLGPQYNLTNHVAIGFGLGNEINLSNFSFDSELSYALLLNMKI